MPVLRLGTLTLLITVLNLDTMATPIQQVPNKQRPLQQPAINAPTPHVVPKPITDSTKNKPQSMEPNHKALPSAIDSKEVITTQRAWLYSMVLPGLGQAYNKKYWKVPIIYLGFAIFGYLAFLEHAQYCTLTRIKNSPQRSTSIRYLDSKIRTFERGRNWWLIMAAFLYLTNIFDAYTDASMTTFNLSNNIGLAIQPRITAQAQDTPSMGLNLTLSKQ